MIARRRSSAKAPERGHRALRLALVASLAAHLLLLAVFPDLRNAAGRQLAVLPPLVARLVSPPAIPSVPASPAPAPPAISTPRAAVKPPPEAGKPPLPAQAAAPELTAPVVPPAPGAPVPPSPVAPAPPAPASPAIAVPASPGPVAPATQVPPAPAAPAGAIASASPAPAAAPAAAGADPVTVEQYRLAIITAGARFKAYPRLALDNNWTGTARVRLVVGPAGDTVSLAVDQGSGHAVLDRAALEMVNRGKPLVPVPERLRGRRFSVEIPVSFELN